MGVPSFDRPAPRAGDSAHRHLLPPADELPLLGRGGWLLPHNVARRPASQTDRLGNLHPWQPARFAFSLMRLCPIPALGVGLASLPEVRGARVRPRRLGLAANPPLHPLLRTRRDHAPTRREERIGVLGCRVQGARVCKSLECHFATRLNREESKRHPQARPGEEWLSVTPLSHLHIVRT